MEKHFGWAPGHGEISFLEMHAALNGFMEKGTIVPFAIGDRTSATDQVKQAFAWDDCAKLGIDYKNIAQEIGDCVSWGQRNVTNLCQITEIAHGERSEYRPVFAPYSYWAGRMTPEGGNGRLNSSDGSLGSWQAAATKVYGCLDETFAGCPPYSGAVAKKWGGSRTLDAKFITEGKLHKFGAIGTITTFDQLLDALRNRYWVTVASMQGYSMQLVERNGRHWFTGRDQWPHQMAYVGVDMDAEGVFLLNQWGPNAHGPQSLGFVGGGWCTFDQVKQRVFATRDAELYAFSQHEGYNSFPERAWWEPW